MELAITELTGDCQEYEFLVEAAKDIKGVEGLTCEVGLRYGMGTKSIIDGLYQSTDLGRTHLAIDPYGNIEYQWKENSKVVFDYTNQMRNQCLFNLYSYCNEKHVNFLFFNLEDVEFFNRFSDGVPIYNGGKKIVNKYALVFLDGPHSTELVLNEVDFFVDKISNGGYIILDDVIGYYNYTKIKNSILERNFTLIKEGKHKASFKKIIKT